MTMHGLTRTRIIAWIVRYRGRLLGLFGGVLIPLAVCGFLAEDVLEREPLFFDQPVLLLLHRHATPGFDQSMRVVSQVGYLAGVVPLDILIGLGLLLRHRRQSAVFWTLAIGGAALLNLAAKQLFGRVRPDLWISIAPETTFSFPSGHAMGSMALVAALAALVWATRWRWVTLLIGGLFVLLVGVSRIYLGVHYPSDIMAGWAASLAWVVGIKAVLDRSPPPASTLRSAP